MTSPVRRLVFALIIAMLLATACSSSGEDASDDVSSSDEVVADSDEPSPSATEAISIPVPGDDGAADAAIAGLDGENPPQPLTADRTTTARDFVRSRFNIDPDPEWLRCVVAESSRDAALDVALQTPSVALGEVDDTQLKALTFAMNGCIDSLSLGGWATQAVGPQGEVRETAPACLADRFDDPERGDVTFYTFAALTYQFRVEPEGVPDVIDAFVACTPVTALSDFFANQFESESGFLTVVDRDCLVGALADPAASESFWSTLIEGLEQPVTVVVPYLERCSADANQGLADTVPSDFIAWSGTGSLSAVVPAARADVYAAEPPMTIDVDASYEAILVTGGDSIRIRLFADIAPIAVNSFVNLARDGYYDNTVFHRVIEGFMAQAGDPTGTGTGGPGYAFADEIENGVPIDRKGLLAMANTGPATNGSQFFITFAPADWLTGLHTVFGEVIEGLDIVDAIELRDPASPTGRGQVIESVTIIEG